LKSDKLLAIYKVGNIVFMNFKNFYSLNFLGRLLLSAIFVNAIPGKITNFSSQVNFIVSKGFPESIASVLLTLAILVLISGSILLIFTNKIKLGSSLLLIFLIPTTIIFHFSPFDLFSVVRNLSLIGGLLLALDKNN
tara:strand:+ start:101 stop:511 length:411 start_codon:yes stop_codon:yes gene_type:complete